MRTILFDDVPSARRDWETLQNVADAHPFQHHAWLETWQATIGAAHAWKPAILLLTDDTRADDALTDESENRRALLPLGRTLERWFAWFHQFQQGLSQHYVLYILVAVVLLLGSLIPLDGVLARLFLR